MSSSGGGQQQQQHGHHPHDHHQVGTTTSTNTRHSRGGRTFVTELEANDVLMGRGAPICDNPGNIRFLALVRERCPDYKRAATRKEKDAIARQIVSTIHARDGLFLRRIDTPEEEEQLGVNLVQIQQEQPGAVAWAVADEKTVLLKIKQALRDRSLEAEKEQPPPPEAAAAAAAATGQQQQQQQQQREVSASAGAQVRSSPPPSSNILQDDEYSLGMDSMIAAHGFHFSQEDAASSSQPDSSPIPLAKRPRRGEISQHQQQQYSHGPLAASLHHQQQQQAEMDMLLLHHVHPASAARPRSTGAAAVMNTFQGGASVDATSSFIMQEQHQQQQRQLQQFPHFSHQHEQQMQQQQHQGLHPGIVRSQQQLSEFEASQGQATMRRSSFAGLSDFEGTVNLTATAAAVGSGSSTTIYPGPFQPTFAPPQQQLPLPLPQQQQQLPHRPYYGQDDWNTSAAATAAAAGFNLLPDTTTVHTNLHQQLQQLQGESLKVDFQTTPTTTFAFPDANSEVVEFNIKGRRGAKQKEEEDNDKKLAAAAGTAKSTTSTTTANVSATTDTSGEAALRKACQVCDMQDAAGPTIWATATSSTSSNNVNDSGSGTIRLDYVELCLLYVLISRGLPTWTMTQFRNGDIVNSSAVEQGANNNIIMMTTTTTSCPLTWTDIGNHLVQQVQMMLSRKTSMFYSSNTTVTQQQRLAIEGFVSRLVSLSMAYSNNPTNLARMTIMLLEKLRLLQQQQQQQHADSEISQILAAAGAPPPSTTAAVERRRSSASSTVSGGDGNSSGVAGRAALLAAVGGDGGGDPDPAVESSLSGTQHLLQTFLSKELGFWATSLNIADNVGFPVPCSSRDFIANFPQFRQNDVFSTAAVLDASGCLDVLNQVSLLTRLRLIFQNHSSDQLISILRTSPAPQWGTSIEETALIDMSLLQALLVNGFSGLLDLAASDDLLGILLRHTAITKIEVEKRAVQLTRLLHQHVNSMRRNRISNTQGARIMEMIGL